MTGMPASLAFSIAGRIALLSCASRIEDLGALAISVSTSVSCCSMLEVRVGADVLAAAVLDGLLHVRLVVRFAQRGCWKLFHDTPTVQPAPDAADAGAGARRRGSTAAARTRGQRPPRTPQRAAPIFDSSCVSSSKCVAIPSRNERRCPARLPPSLSRQTAGFAWRSRPSALLLGGPVAAPVRHALASSNGLRAGRASPPDRRSAARMRAPPHRAAGRRPRASPERPGPAVAVPRARAGRARARGPAPTNGWIRPNRPPSTISSGLKMLTRPASPMPEPATDVVEGAQRGRRSRPRRRAASRRPRRDRRPAVGRPCAGGPPRRPRSPSSRPSRSGTATPFGLTGRWPTSPP